jgi:hypothetical protein
VPQAICVELFEPEGGSCDCTARDPYGPATAVEIPWDAETESYEGAVECGSSTVDLRFTFERVDEQSYFCLESDCLGLVGDYRLREPFSSQDFCQNPEAEFVVQLDGCGDPYCGEAVVATKKADRVEAAPRCNHCGCDCFCRCLCLTYAEPEGDVTVEVCWDEASGTWHTEIERGYETVTFELSIVADEYTGECALALATSLGESDPVPVSCPEVAGFWTFPQGEDEEVLVTVSCAKCLPCFDNADCDICPNGVPEVLHAHVAYERCFCAENETVVMQWDQAKKYWSGFSAHCDIELRLWCGTHPECSSGEFSHQLIGGDGVCNSADCNTLVSCEPFLLVGVTDMSHLCCETPYGYEGEETYGRHTVTYTA